MIKLRLQNKSFDEIAEIVGYSSRGAAYDAFKRAIRRELAEDAGEQASIIVGRTNAMIESLWPIAMGDLSIVPQWTGRGKDATRTLCHDQDPDEPDHKHVEVDGVEQCWVIPSMAKLGAIDQIMKLDKRLADTYGTDFSHGIEDRRQALEEQKVLTAGELFKVVLQAMNPTPEQKALAEAAFKNKVLELEAGTE